MHHFQRAENAEHRLSEQSKQTPDEPGGTRRASPVVYLILSDLEIVSRVTRIFSDCKIHVERFRSAEHFLTGDLSLRSGCILLNLSLPEMNGLELQQELSHRQVPLPFLFLANQAHSAEQRDLTAVICAIRNGAVDFLERYCSPEKLLSAALRAFGIERESRQQLELQAGVQERLTQLTPREHDVLDRLVQGLSSKQIALALGTSDNTVRKQRARILAKMQVDDVPNLLRLLLAGRDAAESPESAACGLRGPILPLWSFQRG